MTLDVGAPLSPNKQTMPACSDPNRSDAGHANCCLHSETASLPVSCTKFLFLFRQRAREPCPQMLDEYLIKQECYELGCRAGPVAFGVYVPPVR